jgi:tetratricopeptide (TPR) repeat protein
MKNLPILFLFATLVACTPKTTQPVTETKPAPTKPAEPETRKAKCPTFKEAPNPDKALEEFVLYRDFMKANDWTGAFDKWKYVYSVAPGADGNRATVFTDGIKFYERFISQDSAKKQEYLAEILRIYDAMDKCYPDGGYVTGLMAFDYFFKYPILLSKEEQYKMFKKSIEMDGGKPRYFILNPFTALLVELTLEEKVPVAEAQKYQQIIRDAVAKGLAECQGKDCENWKIIQEYAPARLEALESIENFYDCAYYDNRYYKDFEENPTDCDVITTVYSRLNWGKCAETDPKFAKLKAAYNANCREVDEGGTALNKCNTMLREGKYRQAAACYEELLPSITDNKQKAQITLIIGKIHYAYLKNYARARQYAYDAAKLRSGWGEPYLLIGTLYASSGPLCGPGRGWDSQVVTWPAIDKWQQAKSIDSGVTAQANKLINQYSQYMPSVEDIFQRGLKEGGSYYVGCWIGESTTIRAAK